MTTNPADGPSHSNRPPPTAGPKRMPNCLLVAFKRSGSTWVNQAVAIEPSGGGFQGLMFLGDRGMVAVGSQLAADGYGSLVQKGC